ncbi:hypothetical protein [Niveispirillum lacus]|uniref:hypothetical protein n=1 Tax=Niveispirillum lacus TaxID=1981099 RepID=UPI001055259D|nr:hypothetical protein [Niveispirillum lacus]
MDHRNDKVEVIPPGKGGAEMQNRGITLAEAPNEEIKNVIMSVMTGQSAISAVKNKVFILEVDDVCQVYEKIKQEVEKYKIVAETISIEVHLNNGKTFKIFSIDAFKKLDSSQKESVKEINIECSITIKVSSDAPPEMYVIEIGLRCESPEKENIMSILFGAEQGNIFTRVRYVDYIVGKNIFNCVSGWADSLPTVTIKKFPEYLRKNSQHSGSIAKVLAVATTSICFFIVSRDSEISIQEFSQYLSLSGLVFCFNIVVLWFLFDSFKASIQKTGPVAFIKFTKGDQERIKRVTSREEDFTSKSRKFLMYAVITVLLNIVSSIVYDSFKNDTTKRNTLSTKNIEETECPTKSFCAVRITVSAA